MFKARGATPIYYLSMYSVQCTVQYEYGITSGIKRAELYTL
jgi:hypothetical protein